MNNRIWKSNYHEIVVYEHTAQGTWLAKFPFSKQAAAGATKEEAFENLESDHDQALQDSPDYKQRFLSWVMGNAQEISEEEFEETWKKREEEYLSGPDEPSKRSDTA